MSPLHHRQAGTEMASGDTEGTCSLQLSCPWLFGKMEPLCATGVLAILSQDEAHVLFTCTVQRTMRHYLKCRKQVYTLQIGTILVGLSAYVGYICATVFKATASKAFSGMRTEDMFKQNMLSASIRSFKIPMQDFIGDLRCRKQKVLRELQDEKHAVLNCTFYYSQARSEDLEQLSRPSSQATWLKVKPHCNLQLVREADTLSPREVNRGAVTHHHWCGIPLNQMAHAPFLYPITFIQGSG
eukprot:1136992-Pelagomonas_calceolata.AAC.4